MTWISRIVSCHYIVVTLVWNLHTAVWICCIEYDIEKLTQKFWYLFKVADILQSSVCVSNAIVHWFKPLWFSTVGEKCMCFQMKTKWTEKKLKVLKITCPWLLFAPAFQDRIRRKIEICRHFSIKVLNFESDRDSFRETIIHVRFSVKEGKLKIHSIFIKVGRCGRFLKYSWFLTGFLKLQEQTCTPNSILLKYKFVIRLDYTGFRL